MSVSPVSRSLTESKTIPSRRMLITDPSQLPHNYSSTPGGSLYSTTPGGTKIIYERSFLMNMRHSPLSQTPPKNIPVGLMKGMPHVPVGNNHIGHSPSNNGHMDNVIEETAEQFQMDM